MSERRSPFLLPKEPQTDERKQINEMIDHMVMAREKMFSGWGDMSPQHLRKVLGDQRVVYEDVTSVVCEACGDTCSRAYCEDCYQTLEDDIQVSPANFLDHGPAYQVLLRAFYCLAGVADIDSLRCEDGFVIDGRMLEEAGDVQVKIHPDNRSRAVVFEVRKKKF